MALHAHIRPDQAQGLAAGRIVAHHADHAGASAQARHVAGHVAHAAQHGLGRSLAQHRDRRFGRDARHVAIDVTVHHQVPDAGDPRAMDGLEQRLER